MIEYASFLKFFLILWFELVVNNDVARNRRDEIPSLFVTSPAESNEEGYIDKNHVLHYDFSEAKTFIQHHVKDHTNFDNHGKMSSGGLVIKIPGSSCENAAYLFCSGILLSGQTFQSIPHYGITIMGWIILLEKPGRHNIFEVYSSSSPAAVIHFEVSSGVLKWLARDHSSRTLFDTAGEGVPAKQWTHVAATYNSTTGISQIYINAQPVNRSTASGLISRDWSGTTQVGSQCGERSLGGFLDEFKIFNHALPVKDIETHMKKCTFMENGPEFLKQSSKVNHSPVDNLLTMDDIEYSKRNKIEKNKSSNVTASQENKLTKTTSNNSQ